MKKKILLSALTVFSFMIAGKTFAQAYGQYHYDNYRHGQFETINQHEFRSDIRDIRHDQVNIDYDLRRIAEKKEELQRDHYRRNWFAYRQDDRELQRLYRDLASDRNDLAMDMRDIRNDRRFAVRF